jgi:aspartyl-tRNA(Asn)/glutamyl-tRNA(Gln) amidotransferase subunit A
MRVAVMRRMGFAPNLDEAGEAALLRAARLLEEQGAIIEDASPELPDTREIFGRVWGVALARTAAGLSAEQQGMLDEGIMEIARR